MTTTISLPTAEYDLAKAYAKEQNLSMDELFVHLIRMLTPRHEDDLWNNQGQDLPPYTTDELSSRIEEGEAQFERGEYFTHEEMMANLKREFSWLK